MKNLTRWILSLFAHKDQHASLRKFKFFEALNPYELFLLQKLMHKREFRKGEQLFGEKNPLELIYFIESGEIEVKGKLQPHGAVVVGKRQHLGLIDMYHEQIRSSSAEVIKDCVLWAVSKHDFEKYLLQNPQAGIKILREVCSYLSNFAFALCEQIEIKA